MSLFSISQLSQFSGIKPHTIRVWEQRYRALSPIRSEGNTRYYDGDQLRRLLNIASLLESDFRISDLCVMPDEKLNALIKALSRTGKADKTEYFISQLVSAALSYNENHFEKILSHALLKYGVKETYTRVMYPLLERIGMLWASDTIPPGQEHFVSNLLRQKLFTAIDSLPPSTESETWILFLPEDEFHEIGLLLAAYLIQQAGKKVIYLGGNVPLGSLRAAVNDLDPSCLFFFAVRNNLPEVIEDLIRSTRDFFASGAIYVSGHEKLLGQVRGDHTWLKTVEDLESIVNV